MAVSGTWYGQALLNQFGSAPVNWTSDTIKVALVNNAYTPDHDVDNAWDDVVAHEVSGAGYTAGGVTLGTKTATFDNTSNEARFDAADAAWTNATFVCRYAVVYKVGISDSASPLLGYIDFGGDESVTTATFTILWNASGVLTVSG